MSVEPNSDVTTRAGIASLDRIRNVSPWGYRTCPNLGRRFGSGARQTLRKFYSSKQPVRGRCATPDTLQTSVTFRTQDLRKAVPLIYSTRHLHKRRARLDRGCAMFVGNLNSPRCSKCEETMSLRIIEPERPGFESQTFECPKCCDSKTLVTPISSAADDSIAAQASTGIPSRSPRPLRNSRDLCSRYRI